MNRDHTSGNILDKGRFKDFISATQKHNFYSSLYINIYRVLKRLKCCKDYVEQVNVY